MVAQKMLDYGFGGYQSPTVPRGPRSVRRRISHERSGEDSQFCAFELLAAVAGKFLQESETSASGYVEGGDPFDIHRDDVKYEQFENDEASRLKFLDQGNCIASAFTPDFSQEQNSKSTVEEVLDNKIDSVLDHTSIVTDSVVMKDVHLGLKLDFCTSNSAGQGLFDKVKGSSDGDRLCDGNIVGGSNGQVDDDEKPTGDVIAANTGYIGDPKNNCANNNVLNNSGGSVQLQVPLYKNPVPSGPSAKNRNNVKLGIVRDDDENYYRFNSTKIKAYKPQTVSGYRRIRKILASKYLKVGHKLKDADLSNSYDRMKPFYPTRKNMGPRERWLHETPSKRRKLCAHSFLVSFDQEASSKSISGSPEKVVKRRNNGPTAFLYRAAQRPPRRKVLPKSRASNVKLSIKSFKVPELYVEVPETATVGVLKRTVMEAVTTMLRDGLRVGIALQGKKVRDDNRTLKQAGISERSNLKTLGFTLEPSLNQVPPVSPNKPSALVLPDEERRISRSPVTPNLYLALPAPRTAKILPVVQLEKPVGEKVEIGLSPSIAAEAFTDPSVEDSKDSVTIPSKNAEARSFIPMNPKPKPFELSHRRIRRPFSVGEVEALVGAIEIVGTGRWRDVKILAFDNADHRTCVDLKDKWKTLVRTASISPQQRRGEPVPQELLDRVLCAHAYWTQQHGVDTMFCSGIPPPRGTN